MIYDIIIALETEESKTPKCIAVRRPGEVTDFVTTDAIPWTAKLLGPWRDGSDFEFDGATEAEAKEKARQFLVELRDSVDRFLKELA